MREPADRLLTYPEPPGPYGTLAAPPLAFLLKEKAALMVIGHLVNDADV